MADQQKFDWIDNYGFILVAFAHMTDWHLANAEIDVINEKLQIMLSQSNQNFNEEEVSKRLERILHRYKTLKDKKGKTLMKNLLAACESLKKEVWFDKISATVMMRFLAEVAEADHKIEKSEIQLLKNLSDVFDVLPPRI